MNFSKSAFFCTPVRRCISFPSLKKTNVGEVTVIEDTDNSAYIVAYFISRSYDESNNTTIANQLLSQKYNELITGYTDNMSVNNIKNRIKMLSE